jgi:plasmid stabilization system protein ParE
LAYRELDDQAQYLAQFSEPAARRLIEACEQTIDQLAEMPEIGSLCQFANPRLQGLRV